MAVNCAGARSIAEACARVGALLVTCSSDLVFDGTSTSPYVESDPVRPLNAYGRSKADCERSVLDALPESLVVRTSAFMDARDQRTFTARVLSAAANNEPIPASADVVSPTYVPALADTLIDLLIDGESGIWHLANRGETSWSELARRIVASTGGDAGLVVELPHEELGRVAPRPAYSALGSERGAIMPTLDESIERLLQEHEQLASV
jgi:dTDP-4-dehydrorhamnose reductase